MFCKRIDKGEDSCSHRDSPYSENTAHDTADVDFGCDFDVDVVDFVGFVDKGIYKH